MERVPQFEAEIPDPLRKNEPKFLAPGGVRTPTVRLLFLILIREDGLKSPTMQVQCHHIGRSKRLPRQGGVEELVDDLTTRRADLGAAFGRRMRGDDDPCAGPCRSQLQIRAVKEGARGSCFRMRRLLVRWLGQAGLHLWQIEEIIVLAAHDVSQSSQIGHNRSIAILSIQAHQGLAQWNSLCFHIGADRLDRLAQFSEVFAVACP